MNKKAFIVVFLIVCLIAIASNNNIRYPLSIYSNSIDSPFDHITDNNLHVFSDKIVIEKQNLIWAKIKDTHSMEPVLNKDSITLEVVPESPSSINQGDIISYLHNSMIVIHRVTETGKDEQGWFAITKGDNNIEPDPYKVRFSQINGLVVGILY